MKDKAARVNFNEVLDKLESISQNMEMQIVTINATIPASSFQELCEPMLSIVNIIEEKGVKVTDAVISPRGQESTISFTCEVNPMLPISKDIRNDLMLAIRDQLGIVVKILK